MKGRVVSRSQSVLVCVRERERDEGRGRWGERGWRFLGTKDVMIKPP